MHDYTQEQNGIPDFSSIVRQSKWPSLSRKIVLIQKFCYNGNLTSHFSSLITVDFSENKVLRDSPKRGLRTRESARASEPASFWWENAIDVVVLVLQTSYQMLKVVSSCDRVRAQPLSIKITLLTFLVKNKKKKKEMKPSGVSISGEYSSL